ncbi:hypothetical protein ACO2Q0_01665 [Phenylobacterium sp. VNQ135]|uniref:hypothetical protein n=1 Tax=Phenylobacterium sp. VNQ135 TaxID=3400922 RepID=UPI003C0402CA
MTETYLAIGMQALHQTVPDHQWYPALFQKNILTYETRTLRRLCLDEAVAARLCALVFFDASQEDLGAALTALGAVTSAAMLHDFREDWLPV